MIVVRMIPINNPPLTLRATNTPVIIIPIRLTKAGPDFKFPRATIVPSPT